MNLTGTPTGSGLSNVRRGTMCNGVQVLCGWSWLSPSEDVGQRYQHGSRKKLAQSLVLVAMESTGTTGRISHADLSDPGSADANPPDPPQTPSRKRKQTASTTSTSRKRVASALAAPTPHSKRALRARARRPAMRAPPSEWQVRSPLVKSLRRRTLGYA
jgi:hypothetical protein